MHSPSHPNEPMNLEQTLKSLLSGGVAGVTAKTVVAPIERIKYLYLVANSLYRLAAPNSAIEQLWQISNKSCNNTECLPSGGATS